MPEYTPTTDEVRKNMAFGVAMAAYVVPEETHAGNPDWPIPGYREEAKTAFDRWLAAHDREVAVREVEEFAASLREWYPEDIFPKPSGDDYSRLHEALAEVNLTLDGFSADLMRRAAGLADRWAENLKAEERDA